LNYFVVDAIYLITSLGDFTQRFLYIEYLWDVLVLACLFFLESLRHCWKPCGENDESIAKKVHLLVESSLDTHLIQTIFFLYLLWACDTTVLVFFQWVYTCTCKRLLSCQLLWKDSSANISRSPFIKLSVYSIRFVIIKTFIKKIFVSTISPFLMMTNLFWINLKFYGCV
jgi:hypothetical protein